jgi:hypothetical protein
MPKVVQWGFFLANIAKITIASKGKGKNLTPHPVKRC